MADSIYSKTTYDYVQRLKKKFGKDLPFKEFWDYLMSRIRAEDMVGVPEYQQDTVYRYANEWAKNPEAQAILAKTAGEQTPTTGTPSATETPANTLSQDVLDTLKLDRDQFEEDKKQNEWYRNFQQLQLAQNQNQLDNETIRAQKSLWESNAANTWQAINQSAQDWYLGTTAGQKANQQQLEQAFEQAKTDLLDTLKPSDWVSRWLVTNKKNPWSKATSVGEQSTNETLQDYQEEEKFYAKQIKAIQEQINDPNNPLLQKDAQPMMDYLKANLDNAKQKQLDIQAGSYAGTSMKNLMDTTGMSYSTALKTALDYANNPEKPEYSNLSMEERQSLSYAAMDAGYGQESATPSAPKLDIPTWMQGTIEGTPSYVSGTDTSKWAKSITPSSQQWNTWSPTQQSMWGNYTYQTGGEESVNDLVASMETQRPQALRLGKTQKAFRSFV
jgi:hypothetical protein